MFVKAVAFAKERALIGETFLPYLLLFLADDDVDKGVPGVLPPPLPPEIEGSFGIEEELLLLFLFEALLLVFNFD